MRSIVRVSPKLCVLASVSLLASAAPLYSSLGAQRLLAHAHHTTWGETEGLPHESMDRVLRSADGYLWLGGEGPLVRFDGVRFTTFDGSNTPALASSGRIGLRPRLIDRDGNMWVSRSDGALVQYRDGRFRVVVKARPSVRYVTSLAQDRSGRIWAITAPNALYIVDGDSLLPATLPAWLPREDILYLIADAADGIWVGVRNRGLVHLTAHGAQAFRNVDANEGGVPRPLLQTRDGAIWLFYEGLQVLRNGSWTRLTMPGTGQRILPTAAKESADGAVWLATRGHGVLRIANDRVEQFTERDGLSDAVATDVSIDEEGNAWIVTEAGLDRLRSAPFAILNHSHGLPFDSPHWIAPDASGAIWAAAFPGFTLHRIDDGIVRGEPGPVTAKSLPISTGNRYLAVAAARSGGVWVHDEQNRISRVEPERVTPTGLVLDGNAIRVFENRRGDLWAAASGRQLGRFSQGKWQGIPMESATSPVREILEDASGRVLVLADGAPNLAVLEEGRVVRRIDPQHGLTREIRNVVVDGVDTLWARDTESALYRIIGTKVSRVESEELGPHLKSRSVALLPAGDKFFIASSSGIASVSRAKLHAAADGKAPFPPLRRYSALDGARSGRLTVLNASPAFRATDGRLWFSTPGGLLVYDPRDDVPNRVAPRVHIEEVRAVDSVLALDSIVRVPPGAERVEFRFTVTSLRLPERARLEYQLEGVDASWRTADASRRVTYTQLRPRAYAFRVRAWNDEGVPAVAESIVRLRVMPLWYQSWWFLSLETLLGVGAISGAVALALRTRARRAAEQLAATFEATLAERTRLAGELHDTLLQAFTGVTLQLQALRGRILAAPDEVDRDIGRVLTVADGALREARSAVWDMRAPELDGRDVVAALEESAREAVASHLLAGGSPVEVEVTVTGRRRRVSPAVELAAQRIGREAVANALNHARAKCIHVAIDFEDRRLCLEVRDDGVGFDVSQSQPREGRGHWGLVGMRERARNAGGTLDVNSAPGSGTAVQLGMPIEPA